MKAAVTIEAPRMEIRLMLSKRRNEFQRMASLPTLYRAHRIYAPTIIDDPFILLIRSFSSLLTGGEVLSSAQLFKLGGNTPRRLSSEFS